MKTTILSLLTSSALLLGACGGSNNNDTPADQQESQPNVIPEVGVVGYSGKVYALPKGSTSVGNTAVQDVYSEEGNVLKVDGKDIALEIPGIISGDMTVNTGNITINGKSYETFIVSGQNYTESKFGYVREGDKDYIFSHGKLMYVPSSGVAKYKGDAALSVAGKPDVGSSEFTVDFGAKTLVGNIKNVDGSVDLDIQATTDGNRFASAQNAAVETSGYFYGRDATEMGGVFNAPKQNIFGSYGAKKVE